MNSVLKKSFITCGVFALSFNLYAGLISFGVKTTVREFMHTGSEEALQKIAKHAGSEALEKFSYSFKMSTPDLIAEVSLTPRFAEMLNKTKLADDEFLELTEAIEKAGYKLHKEGKGLSGASYRLPSCKNALVCGEDGRARLVFISSSKEGKMATASSKQRAAHVRMNKHAKFDIGNGKKVKLSFNPRVMRDQSDKIFFFMSFLTKNTSSKSDVKSEFAKEVLAVFADKESLRKGKIVVDEHVLKIMDLVLQTDEKNIGEVRKWMGEINTNIQKKLNKRGSKGTMSSEERAREMYLVIRKKDKALADELNAKGCYWKTLKL